MNPSIVSDKMLVWLLQLSSVLAHGGFCDLLLQRTHNVYLCFHHLNFARPKSPFWNLLFIPNTCINICHWPPTHTHTSSTSPRRAGDWRRSSAYWKPVSLKNTPEAKIYGAICPRPSPCWAAGWWAGTSWPESCVCLQNASVCLEVVLTLACVKEEFLERSCKGLATRVSYWSSQRVTFQKRRSATDQPWTQRAARGIESLRF